MTIELFDAISNECSKNVTKRYSTSFASAIKLLHFDLRRSIYNIYGFVRFVDEIVDTFHDYDKEELLSSFKQETYKAIFSGISLNPILNSFQQTVNEFDIDRELIESFFVSMELDLTRQSYSKDAYDNYIYGSAEVVGLMCLHVFCEGDKERFQMLAPFAKALGSAFQKVNFLRDFKADYNDLSRVYFPACDFNNFTDEDKASIEADIEADFDTAYKGIFQLPMKARFGVYVAYKYYYSLFRKIKQMPSRKIMRSRIRIPNYYKAYIILRASVKNRLNLIK